MKEKRKLKLKNILAVYGRDFKNIATNPVALIVTLGLVVLPSLYAWVNIIACWDPYGSTSGIKVAVVNLDEGVMLQNEAINVGNMIIDNLKENHSIGWQFVNEEEAEYGLTHDKYYAMLEIPADFSAQLVDVFNSELEKPRIIYRVNEKSNAIAPKITDTGAKTLTNQVTKAIIEVVDKAVFVVSEELGEGVANNQNKIKNFRDAVLQVNSHFYEIEEALDNAQNDLLLVNDILADADKSLPEIESGLANLKDFSLYGATLLADAEEVKAEAVAYLDGKFDEVLTLSDQLTELMREAEGEVNDIDDLSQKVPAILAKAEQLKDVLTKIIEFLTPYQQLAPNYEQLLRQLQTAESALETMVNAFGSLSDHSGELREFLLQTIALNQTLLSSQIDQLQKLAMDAQDELKTDVPMYLENIRQTVMQYRSDQIEKEQLKTYLIEAERKGALYQIKYPQLGIKTLQADLLAALLAIEQGKDETLNQYLTAIENDCTAIDDALPQVRQETDDKFSKACEALKEAYTNQENLQKELEKMTDEEIAAKFDQITEKLLTGKQFLDKAQEALAILAERNFSVGDIIAELAHIDSLVAEALQKAENALKTLDNGLLLADDLFAFADQTVLEVQTAIEQLRQSYNERWNDIIEAMFADLEQSLGNLDNILLSADDAMPKLNELLADGKNASAKGQEMMDQVTTHIPEIKEKIHRLSDLMRQMTDDNLDLLIDILENDPDEMSDYFSGPVELVEERLYHLDNYGSAMAPFYTILAIWVGCLLLCAVLTTEAEPIEKDEPLLIMEEYFGKMLTFVTLALAQSLVVAVGDKFLLGITVTDLGLFIGFCLLSSIVFTLIVYTIVSMLGTVGKAVCVVFLVLQLAGAGGTFPVEVMPEFYQIIKPFLPFTYAIGALREAVAGPMVDNLWYDFKILLVFGVIALLLGLTLKKPLHPLLEWFNKKFKESGISE